MNRLNPVACILAMARFTTLGAVPDSAALVTDMSAPEAWEQAQVGKIKLIDVRTPNEWGQTGVPKGAARIDVFHPQGAQGFLDAVLQFTEGDKTLPLALICRTGNRSGQAQRFLQSQGFTHVINVTEGVSGSAGGPGWLARGLPLE